MLQGLLRVACFMGVVGRNFTGTGRLGIASTDAACTLAAFVTLYSEPPGDISPGKKKPMSKCMVFSHCVHQT